MVRTVAIEGVKAVCYLYVVRVEPEIRSKLREFLRSKGLATEIHYSIALPFLSPYPYLNYTETEFPQSLKASKEIRSLSMFPEPTEAQLEYVVEKLAKLGA